MDVRSGRLPGGEGRRARPRPGHDLPAAAADRPVPAAVVHPGGAVAHCPATSYTAYRARRTGREGRQGLSGGTNTTPITSSTATPTVHQNTRCTPAARPAPEGIPSGPVLATAFTTAPKAATPTAEPNDRENTFVPVTAPRCAHATLDWAAISVGEAVRPIPAPITKQVRPTCQTGVPVPSNNARPAPRRSAARPRTAPRTRTPERARSPRASPARRSARRWSARARSPRP